jgi:hypothetical protein
VKDPSSGLHFRQFAFEVERSRLGFEEACQNYDHRYSGDPRYGDQGHPVGRVLSSADPRRTPLSHALTPFTEEECKAHAQCIFDKYYKEINQTRREIAEQHGQEEWNYDLVKNLLKEEIEKVLTPIVHCFRELELSHLFWDGNGRLHNFCLLNKLLLENDLSPVILDPTNPYYLGYCGIKEIITAICQGQARFESYKVSSQKSGADPLVNPGQKRQEESSSASFPQNMEVIYVLNS